MANCIKCGKTETTMLCICSKCEVNDSLTHQIDKLKADNAELRKLLGFAVDDLVRNDACEYCRKSDDENCDYECETCDNGCFCRDCEEGSNWKWQYQDRLDKALGNEVAK